MMWYNNPESVEAILSARRKEHAGDEHRLLRLVRGESSPLCR